MRLCSRRVELCCWVMFGRAVVEVWVVRGEARVPPWRTVANSKALMMWDAPHLIAVAAGYDCQTMFVAASPCYHGDVEGSWRIFHSVSSPLDPCACLLESFVLSVQSNTSALVEVNLAQIVLNHQALGLWGVMASEGTIHAWFACCDAHPLLIEPTYSLC